VGIINEMDDKKLDVIDSYIDRQQKYINDLLQEKMLLEAKNSYLNQRVEELEKINKENEGKLNILNKRFTEKNEQTMNIKSVFGNLFGGKLDNESEVNNMNPVENINDETPSEKSESKPSPSGKLVIRGGLPPMPKKS
jgi:peptidoglycan hydrolase CwlO-like protein|tara:strand:- start:2598 stop:3011 length:414 start_codon:yes stop_codon:yes gene_type:complete